jgi:hypothetical protein
MEYKEVKFVLKDNTDNIVKELYTGIVEDNNINYELFAEKILKMLKFDINDYPDCYVDIIQKNCKLTQE